MTIGSQELIDMMASFERECKEGRLDREDKELWKIGHYYQDGEVNKAWRWFQRGYSNGRAVYLNQ